MKTFIIFLFSSAPRAIMFTHRRFVIHPLHFRVQFLCLKYFLGKVHAQQNNLLKRKTYLELARTHFIDYLEQCTALRLHKDGDLLAEYGEVLCTQIEFCCCCSWLHTVITFFFKLNSSDPPQSHHNSFICIRISSTHYLFYLLLKLRNEITQTQMTSGRRKLPSTNEIKKLKKGCRLITYFF